MVLCSGLTQVETVLRPCVWHCKVHAAPLGTLNPRALQLQSGGRAETIVFVDRDQKNRPAEPRLSPFQPGTLVVLTLGSPREKFWGAVLALAPEGISLRGVELASFDDLVSMVKEGDPFSPGIIFFPMHRVERMELDLPDGALPSLAQRFTAKTGLDPARLLYSSDTQSPTPGVGR